MSKVILTESQHHAIQQWVDDAKWYLGIEDFEIDVRTTACRKDCTAETGMVRNHDTANLSVSKEFLRASPESQAQTLTHELLHLVFRDVSIYADDAAAIGYGRRSAHIFNATWGRIFERTIDRLSRAIYVWLPPFSLEPTGQETAVCCCNQSNSQPVPVLVSDGDCDCSGCFDPDGVEDGPEQPVGEGSSVGVTVEKVNSAEASDDGDLLISGWGDGRLLG